MVPAGSLFERLGIDVRSCGFVWPGVALKEVGHWRWTSEIQMSKPGLVILSLFLLLPANPDVDLPGLSPVLGLGSAELPYFL